ncbi:hypothetical protein F5879DRAFT_408044 [Lentinula edodes]|nr:hypothetical protein F5879DRAFT_408044 [Lentinula edodes]
MTEFMCGRIWVQLRLRENQTISLPMSMRGFSHLATQLLIHNFQHSLGDNSRPVMDVDELDGIGRLSGWINESLRIGNPQLYSKSQCSLHTLRKNEIRKSATRHPAKGMSLPKERVVRSHPDDVPKGGLPVPLPGEEPPRRIIPRGNDSETLQCPEVGRVLIGVDQALAGTGISVRQAISSRCVNVIGNASELVGSSEQLVRLVASPPNTQPLAGCLSRVPRCKLDNAGPVGIGRPSQGALVPSNVVAERAECSRLDNPCRELFIELFSGLFSRHDLSNEFYFHFAWGLYTGKNPVEDVSKLAHVS